MIEITYKGKRYKDLVEATTRAIIDVTKEYLEGVIRPFEKEIRDSGGKVELIFKTLNDSTISLTDMPQELIDRIETALTQSESKEIDSETSPDFNKTMKKIVSKKRLRKKGK